MRTKYILAISFLVLLVGLVLLTGTTFATTSVDTNVGMASLTPTVSPQTQVPTPDHSNSNNQKPQQITGVSAIVPKKQVGVVGAKSEAGATFTIQDVLDYVKIHPESDDSHLGTATVESVKFLTSSEVGTQFHTHTGLPNNNLVCLVTLKGTFSVGMALGHTRTSDTTYQVYDAITGNLLLEMVK